MGDLSRVRARAVLSDAIERGVHLEATGLDLTVYALRRPSARLLSRLRKSRAHLLAMMPDVYRGEKPSVQ